MYLHPFLMARLAAERTAELRIQADQYRRDRHLAVRSRTGPWLRRSGDRSAERAESPP